MATLLRKVGNSTGTIIPSNILNRVGMNVGDELEIIADSDQIIIKKAAPSYSLDELLKDVTPEMVSQDSEDKAWLGYETGNEIID